MRDHRSVAINPIEIVSSDRRSNPIGFEGLLTIEAFQRIFGRVNPANELAHKHRDKAAP